ncbi:probable phytol kinase 2, chloroplastic isoform X2 [Aristolochia californica]|uniref:probable phytol kinase 2, chloroplastic isoform X2 n=1 Tax=Aristolochia californica TaxID=171875 RepID=UPI0035D80666
MASASQEHVLSFDIFASAVVSGVILAVLKFWEELAKHRVLDQKLSRKLVHISIGLVFMLFWPLFSSGSQAPYLAALAPGINIIRMILLGLGIWKNDALVKSMSRSGDYRELLKGPLYYALTLTIATAVFWRTSPVSLAAVCNLCAGDGVADIVGRRFGHQKLPYNRNKSISGSIAMASAGFLASVVYMHYFSLFGFIEESWGLVLSLLVVSVASAIVESLPISTELDDNLTVPLTAVLLGSLVL